MGATLGWYEKVNGKFVDADHKAVTEEFDASGRFVGMMDFLDLIAGYSVVDWDGPAPEWGDTRDPYVQPKHENIPDILNRFVQEPFSAHPARETFEFMLRLFEENPNLWIMLSY